MNTLTQKISHKISQLVCEEDDIISEENDGTEKTFSMTSDIGIIPSRPSKLAKNPEERKVETPSTLEEEKVELEEEKVLTDREEFVKKCKTDGEWTKWIPERCTPEELKIFEDFKYRINKQRDTEVDDNLCLRFLARRNFEDPDYSYKKILEYFEYVEKYDYENLTREKVLENANKKSQKIFDLGVHNFAGFDRCGRPVVVIKVKNVDKGVFGDIETSRLYLLYQVRIWVTLDENDKGEILALCRQDDHHY